MEREFNQKEIMSLHLVKYLNGTRLSMSQVAEKWGVSTALLSQIKNKKKVPGLELGLKILREGKADILVREKWITRETGEDGEVAKLQYDIERERNEVHLTEKVARQMQSDRLMADIFMDISYMKEAGLSSQTIIREYGKLGISKAAKLIDLGLVQLIDGKYVKINLGKPHFFTPKTSFEFVGDVLKEQAKKLETGDFRGEFNFELNDVPEEVYEELKTMHKDYVRQVIEKIQMYQQPNLKGGRRVIVQMLTSALKCILFIIMLSTTNLSSSWAGDEGNGLAGGASGLERELNVDRIFRAGHDDIIFEGKKWPYNHKLFQYQEEGQVAEYKKWGVRTLEFENKEDAIQEGVAITEAITKWQISSRNTYGFLNMKMPHGCIWKRELIRDLSRKDLVKPVGFNVKTYYAPDGSPRYKAHANFFIPCIRERD